MCEEPRHVQASRCAIEKCKTEDKCDATSCACTKQCMSQIHSLQAEINHIIKEKICELEKKKYCCCCCVEDVPDGGFVFEGEKGRWVPADSGKVPPGAIKSGGVLNKIDYYVARATIDAENLVPGKLTPQHSTCWVAWNNTEIKMNNYEVLVDADVIWKPHSSDKPLPKHVVPAGYMKLPSGNEKLFIARAPINDILVPGYVFATSRELLHSTSFKNQRKTEYELLVYNTKQVV